MILSGNNLGIRSALALLVLATATFAGCGAPDAQFEQNMVYLRSQEFANLGGEKLTGDQLQNVADISAALFGTPDQPIVPTVAGADVAQVLDANLITMASGKVNGYSRELDAIKTGHGLYRQHCVHCHGITGNGEGPTAEFLNPYPRDFRRGKYKFKSTPYGAKPRHEDLYRVIMDGISGTAMPSFKLLDSDEVEALVQYVKYLSVRGEVERNLMRLATLEEGEEGEAPLLLDPSKPDAFDYNLPIVQETVASVVQSWVDADTVESGVAPWSIPPRPEWNTPEEQQAAWLRGRELFYGSGNCFSCHGETALGDGTTNIYDEWTAELEPTNPERLDEYLALGALPPRYLLPRNLRQGVFRGGRRPIDIYWRIRHGIEGATMPAVPYREPGTEGGAGLLPEDIWAIVQYVSSLQYDEFSQGTNGVTFQRDRQ